MKKLGIAPVKTDFYYSGLRDAISLLNPFDREVLITHYYGGYHRVLGCLNLESIPIHYGNPINMNAKLENHKSDFMQPLTFCLNDSFARNLNGEIESVARCGRSLFLINEPRSRDFKDYTEEITSRKALKFVKERHKELILMNLI